MLWLCGPGAAGAFGLIYVACCEFSYVVVLKGSVGWLMLWIFIGCWG